MVKDMWTIHSTAPLNGIYFGYPVGALLSIFIVRSYSQNHILIDKNSTKYSNSTISFKENNYQSELIVPYRIASIFCLISSIGFALIYYKQRQYKTNNQLNKNKDTNDDLKSKIVSHVRKFWIKLSPTTCGEGYFVYGFTLITIILLFNFFLVKNLIIMLI